jgi:hypothetical protein
MKGHSTKQDGNAKLLNLVSQTMQKLAIHYQFQIP